MIIKHLFAFTCGIIRRYTAYPHYIDFENKRICDLWISNPYPFSCKIFMSNQVMIMGHPVVIINTRLMLVLLIQWILYLKLPYPPPSL